MKTKRGVALIWVLILSTVLLIISGTMASYIVKESQFSIRTDRSAQAYAHAKSGIEWALEEIKKDSGQIAYTKDFDLDDVEGNEISVIIKTPQASPETCPAESRYCIESIGRSGPVTRKLEYKTADSPLNRVNPQNLNNTDIGVNDKSFIFQYDFWPVGNPSGLGFGLQTTPNNATSEGFIYFGIDGATPKLYVKSPGVAAQSIALTTTSNIATTTPYAYRATLKYIEWTAASVKIEQRNAATGAYDCIGFAVLPLLDIDMGNLQYLRIVGSGQYITGSQIADGSFLNISNAVYVDNIFTSTTPTASGTEPTPPLPRYTVTATVPTGNGSVNISDPNPELGSNITLTANPASTPGYAFSHWGGDCSGTAATYVLNNVERDWSCTASFYAKVPVYWFTSGLEYFFSTNPGETGSGLYTVQPFPAWYSPSSAFPGAVAVERYRYAPTGRHFFQLSTAREISAGGGWEYEGVAFYAFPSGSSNRTPVYRYRHNVSSDAHLWSKAYNYPTWGDYIYEGEVFRVSY